MARARRCFAGALQPGAVRGRHGAGLCQNGVGECNRRCCRPNAATHGDSLEREVKSDAVVGDVGAEELAVR